MEHGEKGNYMFYNINVTFDMFCVTCTILM